MPPPWSKSMKSFNRLTVLLSVLLLASSASALQLAINAAACDAANMGCSGSDVSLDVVDNNNGTFNVTLSLDSTGYTKGADQDGVVQAGFKAIQNSTSATVTPSDGTWSLPSLAGISSSGLCAGGASSDFICTSGYANIETNKTYTWDFVVTGGTMLDISSWAIKFQYCDSTTAAGECRGKILSAHSTDSPPVPEPSAALVFAGGMLIAATKLRRR